MDVRGRGPRLETSRPAPLLKSGAFHPLHSNGASSSSSPDVQPSGLARETWRLEELTLWCRKLRGVEFAVRPPATSRPNPLLVDSLLVAVAWAPGAILAVDRGIGRPVWRRPMSPLAYDSVYHADGVLYAHEFHTLHALDAHDGRSLWRWSPAELEGESLYAGPCYERGRLFIGDRAGCFWCIDARTGKAVWRQQPSPEEPRPITTTGIVLGDLLVGTTGDDLAVAYKTDTGEEVWRQELDGPGSGELFRFRGNIALRTFWSVYLLSPKDGHVVRRWHWRARYVRQLVCTRDTLLVVNQRVTGSMSMAPSAVLFASAAVSPQRTLVGLGPEAERFSHPSPRAVVGLRWSDETGLVYESRSDGLGIIDPQTGERVHDILFPPQRSHGQCGVVDVHDGVIYLLSSGALLWALSHPKRSRSGRRGEGTASPLAP